MLELIDPAKALRLQFAEAIIAARTFASRTTIAIYGTKLGIPDHIGTAHILQVKDKHFLVTAAHVIDEAQHTTIYCGKSDVLAPLEGNFHRTNATSKQPDSYDFAFLEIRGENSILLDHYEPISERLISHNRISENGRFYIALGYPNSKNKKHDNVKRSVTPRRASYTSGSKTDALAPLLGLEPSEHLVLTYDKQSYDEDFTVVNSAHLRGLSGGPVFDIGSPVSVDAMVFGLPTPILSAMVVEYRKANRALICVKSHLILEAIREYGFAA